MQFFPTQSTQQGPGELHLGLREHRTDRDGQMGRGGQRRSQRRNELRMGWVGHTTLEGGVFQLQFIILVEMEENSGKV